jgi:YjbE family integral membrane protein
LEFLQHLDFAVIFKILVIDILLSADNAIVIALACAALAPQVRNKAIALGTAGAIGARIVFLAIAGLLMGLTYVKLIAGLYLFYIAVSLLISNDEDADIAQKTTIWGAVTTIILADISMSLDNVLAVSAASQSAGEHAIFYTVAGILISIPIIIYGSKLIIRLMEKFPITLWLGGMLLGWVAVEMIISEPVIKNSFTISELNAIILKSIGFIAVGAIAKLKLTKQMETT